MYIVTTAALCAGLEKADGSFTYVVLSLLRQSLPPQEGEREWGLTFLRSPVELLPSPYSGKVGTLTMEVNTLEVV